MDTKITPGRYALRHAMAQVGTINQTITEAGGVAAAARDRQTYNRLTGMFADTGRALRSALVELEESPNTRDSDTKRDVAWDADILGRRADDLAAGPDARGWSGELMLDNAVHDTAGVVSTARRAERLLALHQGDPEHLPRKTPAGDAAFSDGMGREGGNWTTHDVELGEPVGDAAGYQHPYAAFTAAMKESTGLRRGAVAVVARNGRFETYATHQTINGPSTTVWDSPYSFGVYHESTRLPFAFEKDSTDETKRFFKAFQPQNGVVGFADGQQVVRWYPGERADVANGFH